MVASACNDHRPLAGGMVHYRLHDASNTAGVHLWRKRLERPDTHVRSIGSLVGCVFDREQKVAPEIGLLLLSKREDTEGDEFGIRCCSDDAFLAGPGRDTGNVCTVVM